MKQNYITTINNEIREATIRLYGTIGVKVDGDVFAQELAALDDLELDHVKLRINTQGGDVFQGMSIVSAIQSMKTPVYAYIDGIAASMGAVVAISSKKVYMADFAKLMIHDPYFAGTASEELSNKERKALERITDMLRQILSSRGKNEDEIARLMREETWFSADEAKLAGLCDEVVISSQPNLKGLAPMQLVAVVDAGSQSVEEDLRSRLLPILGLAGFVTDDEIIQAVSAGASTPGKDIENALQMGFIDDSHLSLLRALGISDKKAFERFLSEKENALTAEIRRELDNAVQSGKVIAFERTVFENIGKKMGLKTLKGVLNAMPDKIVFSDIVTRIGENQPDGLTLRDYRKYAPQALKDDPELYARLLAKEQEPNIEPDLGLDYYRIHNPDYLKNNPDEYKRLVEKKKNKQ